MARTLGELLGLRFDEEAVQPEPESIAELVKTRDELIREIEDQCDYRTCELEEERDDDLAEVRKLHDLTVKAIVTTVLINPNQMSLLEGLL